MIPSVHGRCWGSLMGKPLPMEPRAQPPQVISGMVRSSMVVPFRRLALFRGFSLFRAFGKVPCSKDGASHHVKVKRAFPISRDVAWCALPLALMPRQPYLPHMQLLRPTFFWLLVLRGLPVVALLAIAPLYESAHAMTAAARTHAAMPDISAQDMAAGSTPHQMPASHLNHDAACRILCFSWVEAMKPERDAGQMTEIAVVLTPAQEPLRAGFEPAPSGHSPKPASFV